MRKGTDDIKVVLSPIQVTESFLRILREGAKELFRKEGVKEKGVLRKRACANPPPKRKGKEGAKRRAMDRWFRDNFD